MKYLSILFIAVSLVACSSSRELPENNGDDSDKMKPSPCVCKEVPFNSAGFTWVS